MIDICSELDVCSRKVNMRMCLCVLVYYDDDDDVDCMMKDGTRLSFFSRLAH